MGTRSGYSSVDRRGEGARLVPGTEGTRRGASSPRAVSTARADRGARADDRPPEPDPGRHDAAAYRFVDVFPACSRRTTTAATTGSPRRTRWTRSPGRCCSWTASAACLGDSVPQWASHVVRAGERAACPARDHELRLRSFDRAGNRSRRTRAVPVHVRYVELARDRIEVVAGRRFGVRVRTDAASYRWLFAGERGVGREPLLVLTAPDAPGTYASTSASAASRTERRSSSRSLTSSDCAAALRPRREPVGTTMLQVILDRSPGIAPSPTRRSSSPSSLIVIRESSTPAFLDDVRRLQRLAAWEIPAGDFAAGFDRG